MPHISLRHPSFRLIIVVLIILVIVVGATGYIIVHKQDDGYPKGTPWCDESTALVDGQPPKMTGKEALCTGAN